jgi:urease subunit alpha
MAEKDLISPGDECVFGGGKTIRDGLAQASGIMTVLPGRAND